MKLETFNITHHKDRVTAVVYCADGQLVSVSDDQNVVKWSADRQAESTTVQLDHFAIDMQPWYKSGATRGGGSSGGGLSEGYPMVIGGSDGRLRFINGGGSTERVVDAHNGAVTCIRWNHEGTAIATCGEDGCVKQWSQVGRLRSRLVQVDLCVYALSWSPDNNALAYCHGKFITIKPLAVNAKHTRWTAHSGLVTQVDWNVHNQLLVTGGEDGSYKVWDSFGRQLYSSIPLDHPIMAVRWAPNGRVFAVGSFNTLLLCDHTGWVHSSASVDNVGSVCTIDWTPDSMQIGAGGCDGTVVFGQLIDRSVEWSNFTVSQNGTHQLKVDDICPQNGGGDGNVEVLDFPDRVLEMYVKYEHLIVVTSRRCYVYSTSNFGTPHIFDLSGVVFSVLQSSRYFLLVNSQSGCQVFSYEGRRISTPRVPGMSAQWLREGHVSLSDDVVAIIDPNRSQVHLCDVQGAKPLCQPLKHPDEEAKFVSIALNHHGLIDNRMLAFIDSNRDLYISRVHDTDPRKLCSMVDGAIWHDTCDTLVTSSDGQISVWYCPSVVFTDPDLTRRTRVVLDTNDLSRNPQLLSCFDNRCTVRSMDGSLQTLGLSPFPPKLLKYCEGGRWTEAIRLCRLLKNDDQDVLWSCLAVAAIDAQELETSELALAALEEVDKVEFMLKVMELPSVEARTAELLLYRRRVKDAEATLLQAGLVYRAIKLNLRLYRWDRAMEIAVQRKTHVDTVLYYRQQFLRDFDNRPEDKAHFVEYARQVDVQADVVINKERQEVERERQQGSGYQRKMTSTNIPAPLKTTQQQQHSHSSPPIESVSEWKRSTSSHQPEHQYQSQHAPPPLSSSQQQQQQQQHDPRPSRRRTAEMNAAEHQRSQISHQNVHPKSRRHRQQQHQQQYDEHMESVQFEDAQHTGSTDIFNDHVTQNTVERVGHYDTTTTTNNNNDDDDEREVEFQGETLF